MFRVVRRSSSGALTVFTASGLHTPVVAGRSRQAYVLGGSIRAVKENAEALVVAVKEIGLEVNA